MYSKILFSFYSLKNVKKTLVMLTNLLLQSVSWFHYFYYIFLFAYYTIINLKFTDKTNNQNSVFLKNVKPIIPPLDVVT